VHKITSSAIYQSIKCIAVVLITFIAITPYCLAAELRLDPETGLIIDKGYKTVNAYCIGCHKGRMIREHGATREDWLRTVKKMQSLGRWTFTPSTESLVVDYLSKHYPDNSSNNE
jgi:hypothetical protein